MHQAITDKVHLEQTSNPADNTGKVQSIDYANDFENIDKETNKLQKFFENSVNTDLLRYLPAILPLAYQGMIYSVKAKKGNPTDSTYKDLQTLQFSIKLPANQYIN